MSQVQKHEMSVSDIRDNDRHVYVINNTKTDISITVKDDDGVSRLLRIMRASIPQDASEIVSPSVLRRTASFKRAISQGYLTLVDEKYAQAILSSNESKMELSSIKRKLSRIPKDLMVASEPEVTPLEAISGGASDPEIRSEVKDIAVDSEEPADDKFARLIAIHKETPLTKKEITWLLSRIPQSNGEYNEIISWLNSWS